MLSVPDMAIFGALALMLFGPEQLPKVARKVGHVMRDVQNTSQAFIREMERAAEEPDNPTASSLHEFPDTTSYVEPFETASVPEEHGASSTPTDRPAVERPPHARSAAQPEYRVD